MMRALRPALAEIRPLVALTVPIVAGFACSTLITVVDTVMVAPLGTVPLAAVSLAASAMILFYSAIYGVVTASGIRISEHLGARAAHGTLGAALGAGLLLAGISGTLGGLVMAALFLVLPMIGTPAAVLGTLGPYWMVMAATLLPWAVALVLIGALNARGRPWQGFGVGALQLAANVPLNWGLIHAAGLGVLGAGIASLLATLVSIPVALWLLRRIDLERTPGAEPEPAPEQRQQAGPEAGALMPELGAQWRAGWPISVAYTAEGGGYAIAGLMLAGLGAAALAANQIVQAVMAVLYMLPLGLATATSLQVGYARGAGADARLRPVLTAAILTVTLWMGLIMLLLVLGGEAVARLLSGDAEVIALAGTLFLVMALMQVFDGVQSASMGALRGLPDTRWPMGITVLGYWIIAMPAAWVLGFPLGMGAPGVWLGFAIGVILAAILLPWRFWRLTGGYHAR